MYSTTAKDKHFREQTGSSSIRCVARGYGGKGSFPEDSVEIIPTLREQAEKLEVKARHLYHLLMEETNFVNVLVIQRQLQRVIAEYGDLLRLITGNKNSSFSRLFEEVARRKLPNDIFESIVDEAKTIWNSSNSGPLPPPLSTILRQRAHRRLSRNCWYDQLHKQNMSGNDVDEIRKMASEGSRLDTIAEKFNISKKLIKRIVGPSR